jgi:adenine phosphoribosyltransferase
MVAFRETDVPLDGDDQAAWGRLPFDPMTRAADPDLAEATRIASELLDAKKVIIPGFPRPEVRYIDFYRTFDRHPDVRTAAVRCLRKRYAGFAVDAIAGIGNGGFGLGSCLALVLNLPFHPIRKAGDTVYDALSTSIGMIYAKRDLTLAADVVVKSSNVVLVDDTIATGGTIKGSIELLHRAGATVVEVATLFETISKGGRRAISPVPLFSILSRDCF